MTVGRGFSISLPQYPDERLQPIEYAAIQNLHLALANFNDKVSLQTGYQSYQTDEWPFLNTTDAYTGWMNSKLYVQAAETITAGDTVNLYDAGGVIGCRLATDVAGFNAMGIALSSALVNQLVEVQWMRGVVTNIGGLIPGSIYYQSATPGILSNTASGTGQIVGIAVTPNKLIFDVSGIGGGSGSGGSPFPGDIIVANDYEPLLIGDLRSSLYAEPNAAIAWMATAPAPVIGTGNGSMTVVGQYAGTNSLDDGWRYGSVIVGSFAGVSAPNIVDAYGYGDVFIGDSAAYGDGVTGPSGIFIGGSAGQHGTGGYSNIAIGVSALDSIAQGSHHNLAIGESAGLHLTTGTDNILIGGFVADGASLTTAYDNVVIGNIAARTLTTGHDNVVLGYAATAAITTGYENIAIGEGVAAGLTTGHSNVIVGLTAGAIVTTGSNNIIIGKSTNLATNTSDKVVIGNGLTNSTNGTTYDMVIGAGATKVRFGASNNSWSFFFDDDIDGPVPMLKLLSGGYEAQGGYMALNTNDAPAAGTAVSWRAKTRTGAACDLFLFPENGGKVGFGTHSALGAETLSGFITIKDSAGNLRKLAVIS